MLMGLREDLLFHYVFLCGVLRPLCTNIQMSANLSKTLFNNSNILEVKTIYEKYSLIIGEMSALS